MGKLTESKVRAAKPARGKVRTIGDGRGGNGLTLRILPSGSKSWTQRVTVAGKATTVSIGAWPGVSLKDARDEAKLNAAKALVGADPRQPRQPKRAATPRLRRIEDGKATLDDCLVGVVEDRRADWKASSRSKQTRDWLSARNHVGPLLKRPVREITAAEARDALRPVYDTSRVVGRRIRRQLAAAVRWAMADGLCDEDRSNPFEVAAERLPRKAPKHEPRKALCYRDVPDALATLRTWGESKPRYATRALAMELIALTGVRVKEAYGAMWDEFDGGVWTIPAERMKAEEEHTVPLSRAALDVLERARSLTGGEGLVFPSPRDGLAFRSSRAGETLKLAGIDCHAHGFRSSFRTWCGESGHDREIAELCLAHRIGNAVEQAYVRSDYLERRRVVMDAWGDFAGIRR